MIGITKQGSNPTKPLTGAIILSVRAPRKVRSFMGGKHPAITAGKVYKVHKCYVSECSVRDPAAACYIIDDTKQQYYFLIGSHKPAYQEGFTIVTFKQESKL